MEVSMAYTEAKKISNQKSDAKYSQILLKPYKEEAARIKKCAADEGMSTQGYILQAVRKQMDDQPMPGVVMNSESEHLTAEKPSCSISPALKRALKKSIQDAVQNFPEEEYDKLRYELDKLIHETFSDEARKPKKAAITQEEAEETQKPTKPLTCKSLL